MTGRKWIRVELPAADLALAARVAKFRQGNADRKGLRGSAQSGEETHYTGILGELAVARYFGVPFDEWATDEDDRRRGCDVAGYQVRTRTKSWYGLSLNKERRIVPGRYLLALAHESPVIWLAGWIDSGEGARAGRWHVAAGCRWFAVDQKHLRPLPERPGYRWQGVRWLVDPGTPFWCEACGQMHAIAEHGGCREAG